MNLDLNWWRCWTLISSENKPKSDCRLTWEFLFLFTEFRMWWAISARRFSSVQITSNTYTNIGMGQNDMFFIAASCSTRYRIVSGTRKYGGGKTISCPNYLYFFLFRRSRDNLHFYTVTNGRHVLFGRQLTNMCSASNNFRLRNDYLLMFSWQ